MAKQKKINRFEDEKHWFDLWRCCSVLKPRGLSACYAPKIKCYTPQRHVWRSVLCSHSHVVLVQEPMELGIIREARAAATSECTENESTITCKQSREEELRMVNDKNSRIQFCSWCLGQTSQFYRQGVVQVPVSVPKCVTDACVLLRYVFQETKYFTVIVRSERYECIIQKI